MNPIDYLMDEHRLLKRMIDILKLELEKIEKFDRLNPILIEDAVDFMRSYADQTHHGKEEEILFRELKKKNLSPKHEIKLNELIDEHKIVRKATEELVRANKKFLNGNRNSMDIIVKKIRFLVDFYPKHIEKEDCHFYIQIKEYFSNKEQEGILKEIYTFDRKMIHKKYQNLILRIENESKISL